MSQVTYDGEAVVFEGPPPGDLKSLLKIFTGVAAEKSRMILSVKVNGHEVLGKAVELQFDENTRVEVKSGTPREMFLKAIDAVLSGIPDPDAAIDPILESLLCESWTVSFGKVNEFMRSLTPFIELLANLLQFAEKNPAPWKSELGKHVASINDGFVKILSFSEKKQIAELTSFLNFEFRPLYADALSTTRNTVRKYFL